MFGEKMTTITYHWRSPVDLYIGPYASQNSLNINEEDWSWFVVIVRVDRYRDVQGIHGYTREEDGHLKPVRSVHLLNFLCADLCSRMAIDKTSVSVEIVTTEA